MSEQTAIIIATDCSLITVSKCDHLFLSGYNWCHHALGYYQCTSREVWHGHSLASKRIHWFVMVLLQGIEIPEGMTIDHIDRDKSNNAQSNLRLASNSLQKYNVNMSQANSPGFVGVIKRKRLNGIHTFEAQIRLPPDSRIKSLGCYATPEEASIVYQAAKKIRDNEEEARCLN